MVLFLVARSLGRARVGRIFQQASRSVVIAPCDTGDESQAEGNLTAGGYESHLREFGSFESSAAFPGASAMGDGNGLSFARMLAMQRQISMGFATAAVAIDKRVEKTKSVPKTKGSAKKKAPERKFHRSRADGPATQWWTMENELLKSLKAWPIDVDLDVLLQDGIAGGISIDAGGVQSVMYHIAQGKEIDAWEAGEEIKNTAAESAEMAVDPKDVPRPRHDVTCSPEDARRSLNLFEWWQRRNPDTPQLTQLNGLLKALSAGGLKEEVGALWATYKAHAKNDSRLVSDFLSAYNQSGMFDEALAVYKEAQDSGLALGTKFGNYAMGAMIAKGYPLDALWGVFTDSVARSGGAVFFNWRIFEALLERGMTIEKILGLKYTNLNLVKCRLIMALSNLGRKDEASGIVQELLKDDQRPVPLNRFVSMLVSLVKSGYPDEAQQLAELRKRLHGLNLGPALTFMMRNMSDGWIGIDAFNTLQALEGPHRTNIAVREELIYQYFRVRATDKVYQAYQDGKQLKGNFEAGTFAQVINRLSIDNRVLQAEEVLADYYKVRRERPITKSIVHNSIIHGSTFARLSGMYWRTEQPQKIVELVQGMVNEKHWVNTEWIKTWVKRLEERGFPAVAKRLAIVGEELKQFRPKFEGQRDRYKPRVYAYKSQGPKATSEGVRERTAGEGDKLQESVA